jgi:hypothetical protein
MGSGLRAVTKRAILEQIAEDGARAGLSLADAISAFRKGRITGHGSGRVITATMGNNHRAEYAIDPELTQTDAVDLAQELSERLREAAIKLSGSPTDSELLTEVLRCLQAQTEVVSDFTDLRMEPYEVES